MSNASPLESDSAVAQRRSIDAQSLRQMCLPALRFAGFWTAVLLPFVLAGLLVSGLVPQHPWVVGGLLAVNFAGLVLGRNHKS